MAVCSKFDSDTWEKWAQAILDDSEPSVTKLLEFLQEQCAADRIMKTGEGVKSSFSRTNVRNLNIIQDSCFVCDGVHKPHKCQKFLAMTPHAREQLIKSRSRCINCFGTGHFSGQCSSKITCFKCNKKHHTLLHFGFKNQQIFERKSETSNKPEIKTNLTERGPDDGLLKLNLGLDCSGMSVILPTAIVEVCSGYGVYFPCRVLLDSGAQASFISERCAKELSLQRVKSKVPVEFLSGEVSVYSKGISETTIRSMQDKTKSYAVHFHVLPKLIDALPANPLHLKSSKILKEKFDLADPNFDITDKIDIIIGADHFFNFILPGKYRQEWDNLFILESTLGWLVSGGGMISNDRIFVNGMVLADNSDHLLEKFWELEEAGITCKDTEENMLCERIYEKSVSKNDKGHYSVDLPFKNQKIVLGESRDIAKKRQLYLERKFAGDILLKTEYTKLMNLFASEGFIEMVSDNVNTPDESSTCYIPHYGILKEYNGLPKLRIIFDAASKTSNGVSLNDCLLPGPKLQSEIFPLLLKFRLCKYVFTADIIKMYRQIKINDYHRNFQRILWRDDSGSELQTFRVTTLMDGVCSAPYLALRTMYQLALNEGERLPRGAKALENRYMDDFLLGSNDLEELIKIRHELIGILRTAGMELDKWCSNDERILSGIDNHANESCLKILKNDFSETKTLGVVWCYRGDYFSFNLSPEKIEKYSKRTLLSETARIFDPLGWIAPITINLKILFQKTWLAHINWDEMLPEEVKTKWLKIRDTFPLLKGVKIKRWIGSSNSVTIHGFCDSSNLAYAAVIYVTGEDCEGRMKTSLLCAKTKLAPMKSVSIARLELCGAQLLARLMRSVKGCFEGLNYEYYCWSDSTTVLAWLRTHPSRWCTFVANRCTHIHELIPDVRWNYVNTKENPADIASRGVDSEKLIRMSLWWCGPEWLSTASRWPVERGTFETEEEVKHVRINVMVPDVTTNLELIERFSSFERLRRVMTYVFRFTDNCRIKNSAYGGPVTVTEICTTMKRLVRILQNFWYRSEIESLMHGKFVRVDSKIRNLRPFLDEDNIIRVGWRLDNCNISYDKKHPILLMVGHFLNVILDYIHVKYYHPGIKLTMSIFRQQFYAPRLRNQVKGSIRRCLVCVKQKAICYEPRMGQLPSFRSSFDKPFETSGVDFAGPLTARPFRGRGNINIKAYVLVIVCMSTHAIHLELVHSLDTESLIMALKRFVGRRGRCSVIMSDNGKSFVHCAKILKNLKADIKNIVESCDVKNYLLENLMEWKFIPCYSPHMGGVWEAGVKSAKNHLSKLFNGRTLSVEEMNTVLVEIESILNSRPISPITEDYDDFDVLTPNHLLNGLTAVNIPLMDCGSFPSGCEKLKRYRELHNLLSKFTAKWKNEFFQDYLKTSKWVKDGRQPGIGDLVLTKRPNKSPHHWSRGRIVRLFAGTDEQIRVVEVRTVDGLTKEMTRNLVPLVLEA